MIGRTVGRYRILAKLGEGGMGSVWKAEDPLLGRSIALKFLPESLASSADARRRFLREARAASTLDHPGIATVYDAGEADGLVYIAMLLVDGATASDLAARGPLPPAEALRIAAAAAEALGLAHARGILHRDVTGRNIMVARDGRVVVVDFGLALPEGQTRLTMAGSAVGTVAYMAPEVAQGKEADRRSDLYGLGVVLYELLTGTLPFKASRAEALLYAAVHQAPEPPGGRRPGLPDGIDRVVLRALEKDPARRHQTADELLADLKALQGGANPAAFDRHVHQPATPGAERISMVETTPVVEVPGMDAGGATPPILRRLRRTRAVLKIIALPVVLVAMAVLASWLWRSRFLRQGEAGSPASFSSVAVLPLKNTSDDPSASDYLADGITQALITKFTQVLNLRVTPWVSAQAYADAKMPLTEIARTLNVEVLVVGTFAVAGDRIQCMVSLVDAKTGQQFWADDLEEPVGEIFGVQRRIATGVAARLKGRLSGKEEQDLARPAAHSVEAYDHYLHGAAAMQAGSREASETALAFFEKAVRLDPGLAEAYVGMGAVYSDRYFHGWQGGRKNLEDSEASYRRALELNPTLVMAQRGLINDLWERGKTEECLKIGKSAERTGREDVETLFVRASAYYFGGLPDKAGPLLRRIIQLDPANPGAHWFLCSAEAWAGRFHESIEAGETFLRRFGEDAEVHVWMGFSYHALGDLQHARVHYETANEEFGDDSNIYILIYTGNLYEQMGQHQKARETWSRGVDLATRALDAYPDNERVRSFLATLHAFLGRADRLREHEAYLGKDLAMGDAYRAFAHAHLGDAKGAIAILHRMTEQGISNCFFNKTSLRAMGGASLLTEPGYAGLMQEMESLDRRLRAEY